MQIAGAVRTPSFAERLGMPPRQSPLLPKAEDLGLHSPAELESLSVARGCWHYRSPEIVPAPNVSEPEFSNEELAVALLSPSQPYSPHTIRVGAAMLGAPGNDVASLVRLIQAEGCAAPVRYIACAALRFEPNNPFWQQLLDRLPESTSIPDGVMPHPTRFVSMTGLTRDGARPAPVWIRPRTGLAMAHG